MIEGNVEDNFWDHNPDVKYIPPFNKLYEKYGKELSSQIMWSLYLLEDPKSSFHTLSAEERERYIEVNYLKNKVKVEKIKPLARQYVKLLLTKEEQIYNGFEKKMEEFMLSVHTLDMNNKNDRNEFQTAMKNAGSMIKTFKSLQNDMLDKRKSYRLRGKSRLSVREIDLLNRNETRNKAS